MNVSPLIVSPCGMYNVWVKTSPCLETGGGGVDKYMGSCCGGSRTGGTETLEMERISHLMQVLFISTFAYE